MKDTLIISFLVIISLTVAAGYFFAYKALKPVEEIVDKVGEITATNLDKRVPVKNENDEIGELTTTFNKMLDRLEASFNAQKNFVSNISHELRTPLSTIVGELQIALIKDRNTEEYRKIIGLALNDAKRLVRLSNGLLDLAKANYDAAAISTKELRVDELLMEARETVLKANEGYKVNILFEREIEDDNCISVRGNRYLLKVAFINLIENACKFSPDRLSSVAISYMDDKIILRFKDSGIGISEKDLPNIFIPFYRGDNKDFSQGTGIGLPLTQKIITLHNGTIQVSSKVNEGTVFTIEIPHL